MTCAHISAWLGSKGGEMERHRTTDDGRVRGEMSDVGLDDRDWNNTGTT